MCKKIRDSHLFQSRIIDDDNDPYERTPDLDHRDRILYGATALRVDMGAYEHSPGCIGDIDDKQVVNTTDLILLLAAWGPCPGCPEDLNGDDIVNTADLLLLLGNWGPCGSPGTISPPQSIQDCIQRYGFDPDKLEACIEGMIKAGTP